MPLTNMRIDDAMLVKLAELDAKRAAEVDKRRRARNKRKARRRALRAAAAGMPRYPRGKRAP